MLSKELKSLTLEEVEMLFYYMKYIKTNNEDEFNKFVDDFWTIFSR